MEKDLFTEEELPRGKMMLVGRSLDGRELACVINPEIEHHMTGKILSDMLTVLKFNDGKKNKGFF